MKMMNNKIQLYFMGTCGYCETIKEHLTANNIEFEARDTQSFTKEWQEIVNLVGLAATPTIVRGNNIYVPGRDFGSPDNLKHILSQDNKDIDNSRVILERTKTLNYNINMAFNRVDQLLRSIESKLDKGKDED